MIKITFIRLRKLILPLTFCVGFFLSQLSSEDILQEVTVNPGDTMWSIANKYLKDPQKWPEIVKHNKSLSNDPTLALPGSRVKIPMLLIKEEYRIAELVKMIPEVRYKRKSGNEWLEARANMTLKYEDSLRTMKGAQAQVRFPSKEVVQINENSYVVLKPERILQEIQLLKGDVRASRAKVIMPGGTIVKPQAGNADYQAKVREDQTEVVFVYKGKVDVTAQGKTVTVPEGYGTQVPKSAPPLDPMPLPNFKDFDPKEITSEATALKNSTINQGILSFKPPEPKTAEKPANSKSKAVVSGKLMVSYQVQFSKDPQFREIVINKTEAIGQTVDVKAQAIPDGTYYMRVAFIDALGVKGAFSSPTVVTKDTTPPEISNVSPAENQKFLGDDKSCEVSGIVKNAAIVLVNEDVVLLDPQGQFIKNIFLKEGINKISVVARDTHGNETTVQRQVSYSKKR